MSETIVPEVKLDNLQAELIAYQGKSVAGSPTLELKIHVPINHWVDWDSLAKLLRRPSRISLLSDQAPLPTKAPSTATGDTPVAEGQLSITDVNADAQLDGPEPTRYSLLLLELPTEAKQLKAALKFLRKHSGLKAKELDRELQGLDTKHPYSIIDGGNEPYVIETKLGMERLGMVVSMVAWDTKAKESEAPSEPAPTPAPKVRIDQLTVGSQWLLKGIGTQVSVHNIVGGEIYFHSLYSLYAHLPAWVFAAAVAPAEPLPELEAVDLAKWENAPVKPVQLDPETEARLQEPWLMPVVELPLGATVVHQDKRWGIVGVSTLNGYPEVALEHINADGETEQGGLRIGEMVEPIALRDLSPLVFHALGMEDHSKAPDEDEGCPKDDPGCFSRSDECHETCERPAELDPTPSTDTEPATSAAGGDLVGQYFKGADGVVFKVLAVKEPLVLLQSEGAAEGEWDDLAEMLGGIGRGFVKPATPEESANWGETTTEDTLTKAEPPLAEVRDTTCVICSHLYASHTSLSPNTCKVCLGAVNGTGLIEDGADEQDAA